MLGINLIVILSIVGGALSTNIDCSLDVDLQCGKINDDWKGQTWPEDEEQLKKACNIKDTLDCQIKYAENCPKSLLRAFLGYLKETKEVHRQLCIVKDSFKQKYLENVQCLNKQNTAVFNTCRDEVKEISDLCEKTKAIKICVGQEIAIRCGEEAREVFVVMAKPALAIEEMFCKKENNFIF